MARKVRKKRTKQKYAEPKQPKQTILPNNKDKTSSKQNLILSKSGFGYVPSRISVVFSRFLYFPCSFSFNPFPFFFKKYFPRKGIFILVNYQLKVRSCKL